MTVKAYRWYRTKGFPAAGGHPAVPGELVRVLGFEEIHGERWCRVRYLGDRQAFMTHPSNLETGQKKRH